ncbi:MAG: 50S ribosomal protein L30 [Firmicutes bacterium]|nr:50S ribosomal protein L30 [Bacillota bacterium]
MAKLKVTQSKSTIGCLKNQIATMEALGLRKIRSYKIHDDNAVIRGMLDKVSHLVIVEEIEG